MTEDIGSRAARPPEEDLLRAILGHPVWKALEALGRYYRGDVPIETRAVTVRAFAGASFFVDDWRVGRRGAGVDSMAPDDALELALDRVSKASWSRRALWLREQVQLMELDGRTNYEHHFSGLYVGGEPIPPDDRRPLRLSVRPPLHPGDDDYAGLAEGAAQELEGAVERFLEPVWRREQQAAADAFWRGLREAGWVEIDSLAGHRHPAGRAVHPRAIKYWRQIYQGVAAILTQDQQASRYQRALVRPQEWDHWSTIRKQVTAHQAAACLVWDRARRPGALTTFAQKLGTKLRAEVARDIDVGVPLADVYFDTQEDHAEKRTAFPRTRRDGYK